MTLRDKVKEVEPNDVDDEYIGGCLLIGVSLPLNIMWLIREIKEGEEDE